MTEDIRLYNLKFELLYIAHRVKSSAWEMYYNKIGTFEAHICTDKYSAKVIFDNKYLIAAEGNKQAFVTAVQVNTEIVLYGKTLNYLLSKRCVMPFNTNRDGIENNPVTLCNKLVTDTFINDRTITDANGDTVTIRGVKNMTVTDNSTDFETSDTYFWRTAAHALSEVITDRLNNDGLGHRLIFDTALKEWRFEIYSGKEIPLILSQSGKNFYNADYTFDISSVCNAGYYEPTTEFDADGTEYDTERDREYIFIANERYNASTDDYSAICEWDMLVTGTEAYDALAALEKQTVSEEIKGNAARIRYDMDYTLGDIIRVQLVGEGFRRTLRRRVGGVRLYRESDELSSEPILENVEVETENGD